MKYSFITILIFFAYQYAYSQYTENLPIHSFLPNEYRGENQNWAISEDENNFIYFANNGGLISYNGSSWNRNEAPTQSIIRSVLCYDKKVFVGGQGELGFWKQEDNELTGYQSLNTLLENEIDINEQFWNIHQVGGLIVFTSSKGIYIYNINENKIVFAKPESSILKSFLVNGFVFVQLEDYSIWKYENRSFTKSSFSENVSFLVSEILEIENNIVLFSRNKGIFEVEANQLKEWRNIRFASIFDGIYCVQALSNNRIALGTISDGLILMSLKGEVITQFNKFNGLSNNTVLSIYEDKFENLWVGSDYGINLINLNSPIKVYRNIHGVLGTVYSSIVYENDLYLGTNQGLFKKKYKSNDEFELIKNSKGQVWSLKQIDGLLFCGHDTGTYIYSNGKLNKISGELGTWDFVPLSPNLILQGNYQGLHILEKGSSGWKYSHKVKGFDISSKFISFFEDNIWVSNEQLGVFKLKLDDKFRNVLHQKRYTSPMIETGIHSSLIVFDNTVLYANNQKVYEYKPQVDSFVMSEKKNQLFKTQSSSFRLIEANQSLWSFTDKKINRLIKNSFNETPLVESIELGWEWMNGYENILHLEAEKYLIGNVHGYTIVDLDKFEHEVNTTVFCTGYSIDGEKKQKLIDNENFSYDSFRKIQFEFKTPNYNFLLNHHIQYQLEGYHEGWQNLGKDHQIVFENLAPGDYIFHYSSTIKNEPETKKQIAFSIATPFYKSALAILCYLILFLSILYWIYKTNKRKYLLKEQKLIEENNKKIAYEKLQQEKLKIQIRNEKLNADIKSKEKELAISTMLLLKRNNFLSDIKNKLSDWKAANAKDNVKDMVKSIDDYLGSNDDWELFEKAFRNVDKEFFKKLKSLFPQLTSNDLKVCAYLRLNLTSKEIASLLNISPKSVEIKRYRLRKKINLEKGDSLTDFILNI